MDGGPRNIPVTIKATREEILAWEAAAAAAASMTRQGWCKAVLNAAAQISALPKQLQAAHREARRLERAAAKK
jgi:hypothetical protein